MNILSLLLLLAPAPTVVARLSWWVDEKAPLKVVVTERKEVVSLTVTHLSVRRGREVIFEQDDVGYFRGAHSCVNEMVTLWTTGSSGKVVVLTYRDGRVTTSLEAYSKWLPELVYEHGGLDLVIMVPDDSTARRGPPGGPPLTATIYRKVDGRYVSSAQKPWAKRFEGLQH